MGSPIVGVYIPQFKFYSLEDSVLFQGTCRVATQQEGTHNPKIETDPIEVEFKMVQKEDGSWAMKDSYRKHYQGQGLKNTALECLEEIARERIQAE